VNIVSSLILMRVSFLTSTTVVVGINVLSFSLLFITKAVLSALLLPLVNIMIVCVYPIVFYI
jgi:hypothetical protein